MTKGTFLWKLKPRARSKAQKFSSKYFFHEPISYPGFLGASWELFINSINFRASRMPPKRPPRSQGRKSVNKKIFTRNVLALTAQTSADY
jgi:hypothetical protein